MGEQAAGAWRYVRCGPFNSGAYVDVPVHEFTRQVQAERKPQLLGPVTFWGCTYCQTTISSEWRRTAEQHPCDGHARCAICNDAISYPFPRCVGTRFGMLCQACEKAALEALKVQAVAP